LIGGSVIAASSTARNDKINLIKTLISLHDEAQYGIVHAFFGNLNSCDYIKIDSNVFKRDVKRIQIYNNIYVDEEWDLSDLIDKVKLGKPVTLHINMGKKGNDVSKLKDILLNRKLIYVSLSHFKATPSYKWFFGATDLDIIQQVLSKYNHMLRSTYVTQKTVTLRNTQENATNQENAITQENASNKELLPLFGIHTLSQEQMACILNMPQDKQLATLHFGLWYLNQSISLPLNIKTEYLTKYICETTNQDKIGYTSDKYFKFIAQIGNLVILQVRNKADSETRYLGIIVKEDIIKKCEYVCNAAKMFVGHAYKSLIRHLWDRSFHSISSEDADSYIELYSYAIHAVRLPINTDFQFQENMCTVARELYNRYMHIKLHGIDINDIRRLIKPYINDKNVVFWLPANNPDTTYEFELETDLNKNSIWKESSEFFKVNDNKSNDEIDEKLIELLASVTDDGSSDDEGSNGSSDDGSSDDEGSNGSSDDEGSNGSSDDEGSNGSSDGSSEYESDWESDGQPSS
jgi:hypothetical protein